jgi:hypothetical protein
MEAEPYLPKQREGAMGTLRILTPVWAVGPECNCIQVTPAQYIGGSFSQWGLQVSSMKHQAFLIISPLIIQVIDEISIGTNVQEQIIERVLEEVRNYFHDSKPEGVFHTGPITGLFSQARFDLAWECFRSPEMKNPEWERETQRVISDLVHTYGVPYRHFQTYDDMRVVCES